MDRYQYLLLMGGCFLITLPLEVVFGARVWRRPVRLLKVVGPVVAIFYVWDIVAIARGHWTFSERYTTGVVLPGGVPLEELVFFVIIPICALLSYEAVRNLLGHDLPSWVGDRLPYRLGGNRRPRVATGSADAAGDAARGRSATERAGVA